MKSAIRLFILFIVMVAGCTAPHYIWKQNDMGLNEINSASLEQRVLIASRDSEFKQALVDRITGALADRSIYIKIIGIETLADEDAGAYSAVVIINTAMGWTVDVPVEAFLEKYGAMDSIIVLTTADGGDVLPDMNDRKIDAMSSASVMDHVVPLADTIIAKVDRLIN
jgi:hypothetical protein